MADQWLTALADANWVPAGNNYYMVDPNNTNVRTLMRRHDGISRASVQGLKSTLDALTTVTNPKIDNVAWTGTWRVTKVEIEYVNDGALSGSASIIEILSTGLYDNASDANMQIFRIDSQAYEQVENPWMFYERYVKRETKRWLNMSLAGATSSYEKFYQILLTSTTSKTTMDNDYTAAHYYYNSTIIYADIVIPGGIGTTWQGVATQGKYYQVSCSLGFPVALTELTNPQIEQARYELEQDGSYTLYRTLYTMTAPALMRTRTLQYAGMVLTAGTPTEGSSSLAIDGLNTAAEVVYANATLRVNGDSTIYRVTTNATASSGAVTLTVTPNLTQAAEDGGDNNQIFFSALY